MRRVFASLILVSVPLLMLLQVFQAYRYAVGSEDIGNLEKFQEDRLEENKRLMAGIAVYDAPERVYQVASQSLGLHEAMPENVLQVHFPDDIEVLP